VQIARRLLVKASAAFAGTLMLSPFHAFAGATGQFSSDVIERRQPLIKAYRETVKRLQSLSRLPIVDIEHHWGGKLPISELIEKMDRNDVALTWLGANERNGSKSSVETCRQFPSRLVPTTIHGDGPLWHGKDLNLVQELDADVRTGNYFAMGEFEARHYVSNTNSRDIHMPLDSDSFHGVFKAAEATGIPFLLHHEAEDALLPELEKMLTFYPKANIVWCHVGRNRNPRTWTQFPSVEGVKYFIQKYPNLHFDIVQSGAKSVFPPTGAWDSILYSGSEQLLPEWVRMLNTFPDRFLIGSDINTGRWDKYDQVMYRFRTSVLRVLTPEASEKIAFGNAWRLMTGETWQS
jgi:predicted TIM-barrel fold metal-dependent hydrolase